LNGAAPLTTEILQQLPNLKLIASTGPRKRIMDLGFLPESLQYFSISGRVALTGLKGYRLSRLQHDTLDKVEFDSEPIRLTFDASKGDLGSKIHSFCRCLGGISLLAEQVWLRQHQCA
jgi:hypothetical protein